MAIDETRWEGRSRREMRVARAEEIEVRDDITHTGCRKVGNQVRYVRLGCCGLFGVPMFQCGDDAVGRLRPPCARLTSARIRTRTDYRDTWVRFLSPPFPTLGSLWGSREGCAGTEGASDGIYCAICKSNPDSISLLHEVLVQDKSGSRPMEVSSASRPKRLSKSHRVDSWHAMPYEMP